MLVGETHILVRHTNSPEGGRIQVVVDFDVHGFSGGQQPVVVGVLSLQSGMQQRKLEATAFRVGYRAARACMRVRVLLQYLLEFFLINFVRQFQSLLYSRNERCVHWEWLKLVSWKIHTRASF